MRWQRVACLGLWCLLLGGVVEMGRSHEAGQHSPGPGSPPAPQDPQAPINISMEELHQQGGVPRGWKFRFPEGDPKAGREVFVNLECYQCHAIQGESFPTRSASSADIGPELTGMGGHHPVEYLAESIVNPNAVVITGPGYTDAAGLSIMPDYRESLTVAELIDLVAYLKSLAGEHAHESGVAHHGDHTEHNTLVDQVVGDYHVRVMYHAASVDRHAPSGHGHGRPAGGTAKAPRQDHLMAFITDTTTGHSVPYLPVTLTVPSPKQTARTVKLSPMLGAEGFHYGADFTLPKQPAALVLSIGATNMRLMPSAAGRFNTPQEVTFQWTPPQPVTPIRERPLPHDHGTHGTPKGR